MNTHSNHFDLNLERSAMFNVPDAAGMDIVCRDGTVWITLDNDQRDYVLEAGDVFRNTEHKRALIYALQASSIAITSAAITRMRTPARQATKTHGLVLEQVLA
ncbi:MAG: DUF2917 domain-containing protein [Pseudomonadota bacterium]